MPGEKLSRFYGFYLSAFFFSLNSPKKRGMEGGIEEGREERADGEG